MIRICEFRVRFYLDKVFFSAPHKLVLGRKKSELNLARTKLLDYCCDDKATPVCAILLGEAKRSRDSMNIYGMYMLLTSREGRDCLKTRVPLTADDALRAARHETLKRTTDSMRDDYAQGWQLAVVRLRDQGKNDRRMQEQRTHGHN